MSSPDYIVFIQSLLTGGLTQTELARRLGVTHATLNRWLHSKSSPHPQHIKAIEAFYLQHSFYARLEKGVDVPSWEKKFLTLKGDWVSRLEDRRDLWEELLLRLTYHTNRIEGSTLSLQETQAVLFDRHVFAKHSLTEHLEATNHRVAFLNLLPAVQLNMNLDLAFVKMMNRTLMNGILDQAGLFRDHPVRIVGSRVLTCNHLKITERMTELCAQMEGAVSPLAMIMQHAWFEQIHPFSDGNGRVGRLLLNFQFLRTGYPPIIIRSERKIEYYQALEKAQVHEQYEPLITFCFEELKETSKLD